MSKLTRIWDWVRERIYFPQPWHQRPIPVIVWQ